MRSDHTKDIEFDVADDLLLGDTPVTLITTFQMRDGAPGDRFVDLWTQVASLMQRRPGFISSRLYRPTVGGEAGQYIMVARWAGARLLAAAQGDPEIRAVERELHSLLISTRRVLCEAASETIARSSG